MQAQECSAFAGDGYDEEKFIRGAPRLYPDVRVTVRVLTQADRDRWIAEVNATRPEQKSELTTRWMASRIVIWDLPEPPSVATCGKLVPALYDRLFAIVWGNDGGDEDDLGNSPAG